MIYYHTKIVVVSTIHTRRTSIAVHVIHAATTVVNMSYVRMRNNTLYIHNNIIVHTDTTASDGMRAYNTIYYRYVCIIVAGWPEARLSICGNALNENLPRASESFPVGQFPRATFSPTVCPSVNTYRYRMVRIIISRYTYEGTTRSENKLRRDTTWKPVSWRMHSENAFCTLHNIIIYGPRYHAEKHYYTHYTLLYYF